MSLLAKPFRWLYNFLGMDSVRSAGLDAYLIIWTRCNRMIAYGFNSLVMALFFAELGFTDPQIGLFMTLTLLGDVLLSVLLTLVADQVGRRKILLFGSFMMVISGAIFAIFENFWILLVAAVVGVISATGGDCGPFRAVEESTLSHLTTPKTRADVLAWYVTTTTLSSSIGTEISGRVVHYLQGRNGWTLVSAYHATFWVYTGMGLLNMGLTLCMSKNCEAPPVEKTEESEVLLDAMSPTGEVDNDAEDEDSKPTISRSSSTKKKGLISLFAQISKPTRSIMYKLWLLLGVDSLADGMVPYSLMTYYVDLKFHVSKATLGDITSASQFLCGFVSIFAGPLSNRIGLINTMVFTHLPSSIASAFIPLPSGLTWTVVLLLFRAALNSMDQAPRSAFIAAVVKPEERTAVMGITSMIRTLAQSAGPTVTGLLAGSDQFWIAFVLAGFCRVSYDLGLWVLFINVKLHQHEDKGGSDAVPERRRRERDEEEIREVEK